MPLAIVMAMVGALPVRAGSADAGATLSRLRVEGQDTPLAIDAAHPRFSWQVQSGRRGATQLAWRVTVATSPDLLDAGKPDVWDSGRVASPEPFGHPYDGRALTPGTTYFWKVVVDTNVGHAVQVASFSTGLTGQSAWAGARWIGKGDGGTRAAPLLRRAFNVEHSVERAVLYVAAGGYADVTLDGKPVSPAVLSPGFTNYDKRVQYVAVDVTRALQTAGPHVLGMELGRGFYGLTNPNVWHWERAPWHGEPRVIARLAVHFADGRQQDIVTDDSWKLIDGPTLLDDLYGGEAYDARRVQPGFDTASFNDSAWHAASLVPAPRGRLVSQPQPPITVAATLAADEVTQPKAGVYVFRFPRVIAGWVTFRVTGHAGDTIVARYGEKLLPDGSVDVRDRHQYFKEGFQTDRFTLSGKGAESWHAKFSYKGFRYVEVSGWPGGAPARDAITAQVVHSNIAETSSFDSDNDLLNWIHRAAVDTVLNNLQGIPTDTPMYEKNGWTGDAMVGADMMLRNLDAGTLLAKWVDDISDARNADGAPLLIAPNPGWGDVRAPPWHAAYIMVPWSLYLHDGDRRVLADHEQGMAAYVNLEYARSPGGIATTELGDWVSPETNPDGENAPEDKRVAATAYLYLMATTMADIEHALGRDGDAAHFSDMAHSVRKAFNRAFYDTRAHVYRGVGDQGYRQAHNLFALAFGLAPQADRAMIAANVARDVRARDNHLDTGALATKIILPVLSHTGHQAEAFAIATQVTFPSWGFWRAQGATSLWEHWKAASRSWGHYFLGTADDWLFGDVVGLRPLEPGWRRIEVAPLFTGYLDHARGSVLTPYGRAAVSWQHHGSRLDMEVDVPVGAHALVRLPTGHGREATESSSALGKAVGVHAAVACRPNTCVVLDAGHYAFSMPETPLQ
jgi:alpha-L-rhamnosidase